MASIHLEIPLQAPAERVWKQLRDVGEVKALFPGVLTASRLEGDARVVTCANGMDVKERIVDVDEKARRVAYAVVEWQTTHHNASMQVLPDGEARSRLVWITDLLPDELAPPVRGLMEQGAQAVQRVFASAR
ncbi:MAG TPA: SRPBCC family protein [Myxococcota bacterium]|nr:SRPBCC family protein [Myxococcota bacterium]